jgi:hypothetical protein
MKKSFADRWWVLGARTAAGADGSLVGSRRGGMTGIKMSPFIAAAEIWR